MFISKFIILAPVFTLALAAPWSFPMMKERRDTGLAIVGLQGHDAGVGINLDELKDVVDDVLHTPQ